MGPREGSLEEVAPGKRAQEWAGVCKCPKLDGVRNKRAKESGPWGCVSTSSRRGGQRGAQVCAQPDIQRAACGQRARLAPEDEPGADAGPAQLPHPLTLSMPLDCGFHLGETPASNWAQRSS